MNIQALLPQRGVSLIFALLTVAALSLTAVALIRAVDTGATILGNLSFKQDTLLGADEATRRATQWLWSKRADIALHNDIVAKGYSARLIDTLDATGVSSASTRVLVNWDDKPCSGSYARCITPSDDSITLSNGVKAQYIVLRLCSDEGDPALGTIRCSQPLSAASTTGSERGEISAQNPAHMGGAALAQYYRIVVRAQGGRKTVSTTETLVHF